MDIADSPYIDALIERVDGIELNSPKALARVLPLYVRVFHSHGLMNAISISYIEGYSGDGVYRRFARFFDQMYEMFLRNGLDEADRRKIFKQVAQHPYMIKFPSKVKDMEKLSKTILTCSHKFIKGRRAAESRLGLVAKFKTAIKKYLHLTYSLGFNEPSACAMKLAKEHRIDKYIMSGDFQVMLLPFLPDLERTIKSSYEHYGMTDAWDLLKGRYFNHKDEFNVLAIEIKSMFNRNIVNFSDYFDKLYTDTYYRMMLKNPPSKGS